MTAWPASRSIGIGLVTGLHAAFIGLLMANTVRPVQATAARAFQLVTLRAVKPVPPAELVRQGSGPPRSVSAGPARPSTRPEPPPPAEPEAITLPLPAPPALPVPPDPFAESAPAAPAAAPSLAERARGSAGRIARELDRESAREAPAVLTPGALAARRDKEFGRAFQGGPHGFTVDRYVSPDGVSVTRQTSRRGVSCYIPAPFQPSVIPRSSERQKEVSCPPDDGRWQRH